MMCEKIISVECSYPCGCMICFTVGIHIDLMFPRSKSYIMQLELDSENTHMCKRHKYSRHRQKMIEQARSIVERSLQTTLAKDPKAFLRTETLEFLMLI